jgi:hypothetical protein
MSVQRTEHAEESNGCQTRGHGIVPSPQCSPVAEGSNTDRKDCDGKDDGYDGRLW